MVTLITGAMVAIHVSGFAYGTVFRAVFFCYQHESPNTQIAQLRWRNVATVGMVAVGTTTLAQRRHGRRWHNYVGATSFSLRWPNVRKLRWANVFLPTICQQCRPC